MDRRPSLTRPETPLGQTLPNLTASCARAVSPFRHISSETGTCPQKRMLRFLIPQMRFARLLSGIEVHHEMDERAR